MERIACARRLLTLIAAALLNSWLCLAQTPVNVTFDHAVAMPNARLGTLSAPTTVKNGFSFGVNVLVPQSFAQTGVANVTFNLNPTTFTRVENDGGTATLTPGALFTWTAQTNVDGLALVFNQTGHAIRFTDAGFIELKPNAVPQPAGAYSTTELAVEAVGGVLYLTINVLIGDSATEQYAGFRAYYTFQGPTVGTAVDLAITRMIPAQGVHGTSLDIPMIAGSPTAMRVFVRSLGATAAPVPGVNVMLSLPDGERAGPVDAITATPYNGPIPPDEPPCLGPTFQAALLFFDIGQPPCTLEPSVDITLPDSWVAKSGKFDITATIVLPPGFQDPNPGNNTMTFQLVLFDQPNDVFSLSPNGTFDIGYVAIDHQPPEAAAPNTVTQGVDPITGRPRGVSALTGEFIRRLYPVGTGGVHYHRLTILKHPYTGSLATAANVHMLVTKLAKRFYDYQAHSHQAVDQLVGFVPREATNPLAGSSDPPFGGGKGQVLVVQDFTQDVHLVQNTEEAMAHEIGHNLGLRHDTARGAGCRQIAIDDCGTPAVPNSSPFWPYSDPTIQVPGYAVHTHSTVSAFDFDMMSYCDNPLATNIWISPAYYQLLFKNDLGPSLAACPKSPSPGVTSQRPLSQVLGHATTASTYVTVSGTVSADGKSGTLDPVFQLTTTALPSVSDPNGAYCLNVMAGSVVQGQFCFTPSFVDSENNSLTNAAFQFLVTAGVGATGLTLTNGAQVLASAVGAPNAPTVSISAPATAATISGSTNLLWSGSSSASLTYIVDYSYDGGTSWIPLTLETTGTSIPIGPGDFLGPQIYLRVQASDGFKTGVTQVGPINVTQSPKVAVSPAALNFQNGLLAIAVERSLVLTSAGSSPLQVSNVTFSNPAFTLASAAPPFSIFAGDSETLLVHFSAPAAGAVSGTMTITTNDPKTPSLTVPLQGTGITTSIPQAAGSPSALNFGPVSSGSNVTQNVTLQNYGPGALQVTSMTATGAGFSIALASATAPLTVAPNTSTSIGVQFAPTQVSAFTGTLTMATNDPASPNITVSLTGTGTPATAAPELSAAGVVNAASFTGGGVSPGEIVTIFGSNLGPAALAGLTVSGGAITTSAGGTQVLFDGVAAPIIYSVAGQVTAVVPYEVAGEDTTRVQVTYNGITSNLAPLPVVSTAPALFSALASGKGQGAILNQDNSVNSSANPAAPGSVVVLFGTGEGQTIPNGVDGLLNVLSTLPAPAWPVTATIDRVNAKVLYAGAAPGLVAGVLQVNLQVPSGIPGGDQPVVVTIAGASTQAGLTVAIKGTGATGTPRVSVTPSPVNFGSSAVGVASSPVTVSILNSGTAPLTVSAISIGGAQFKASGVPAPPFTIAAGGQVSFQMTMTPTGAGGQTGTLTVVSNDPGSPTLTVNLTGTGTAAAASSISVSPASLSFGNVTVGQSATATFSVLNSGNAALTVSSIVSSNALFSLTGATSFTVPPGSSTSVTVKFAPTAAGMQIGALTIASNDPANPSVNVALSGMGVAAATPAISTPSGVNFSSVAQGGSKQVSLTVKNAGGAPLNVTSVTAGGAFSVTSSGSFSVASGASSAVTLQFNPSSAGGQTGTVSIASNDPVHPNLTLPVWGNAYIPANVLTSDSFNRANAGDCALGTSDAKFGGGTIYHYLPDWPGPGGPGSPVGASISGGVLTNNGNNYGGVQLTTSSDTCNTARGATLAQDLDIVVDLYVPKTGANLTDAGPYFRSRSAAPGDGLGGGTSSGYWVELLSTGQVLVNQLNPFQTIAQAAIPASFDSTIFHNLEARVQGAALQVTLDGTLQTFNGSTTVTVSTASNNGAVGISFGSEMNPQLAGGQAAGNLVISSVGSGGTGSGGAPAIGASTTSLGFGSVVVGQVSTLTFNVLNTGTAPLTVSSVVISNPAFGLMTPNIPLTVQPAGTTPVTVVFAPQSAGAQSATFTVTSNDPVHPIVAVSLTGTGTGAANNLLAYSNVVVGQSETGTLTLTNTGTTPLTVTAQTTTNAAFTVTSPSTPYNIPAGQTAAIMVVFQPTAYTVYNATLSIVTSGSTLTTPLSGAGVVVE